MRRGRPAVDTGDMNAATAPVTTAGLQARARRLRSQAATLHPVLAESYRRRAAELDAEAWLQAVWNPPVGAYDALPAHRSPGTAVTPAPHLAVA
jgi:hypothetical protein